MATVVDHLIIEIGLDPKNFDAGSKKSAEAFLKMVQTAEESANKTVSPLEKMGEGFDTAAKKAASFFAAFISTRALISTAKEITNTNVAIGNLSKTTGESVRTLSLFANATERAGGSTQGMLGLISGMNKELQGLATGQGGGSILEVVNAFNKAGASIDPFDKNNLIKKPTELILELVDAMDKLNIPRPNALGLLRKLPGMDEETLAVLSRGGVVFRKLVEDQKEIAIITDKDVEAANRLTDAWYKTSQSASQFARTLLTELEPALTKTLNKIGEGMQPADAPRGGMGGAIMPSGGSGGSGGGAGAGSGSGGADAAKNAAKLVPTDNAPEKLSVTPDQWNAYRKGVASIEGGNYGKMGGAGGRYAGAYQMGPAEIQETAKSLGEFAPSPQQFLGNKQMQERYFAKYTDNHHQQLMKNPRYAAMTTEQKLQVLGYAHNQGVGGANQHLNTGEVRRDGFGTPGTRFSSAIQKQLDEQRNNAPVPWLSNPRMLRAPRFNSMLSSSNNYATSETTVHSLIVNGTSTAPTDDAYGLSKDAVPSLMRRGVTLQATEGPR